MRGSFYINLFIILLLSVVFGPRVLGIPAVAGMQERLQKSVVQVLCFGLTEKQDGLVLDFSSQSLMTKGTGFCVDAQNGYFVTNKHVANLMQYRLPKILSFSGKVFKARVVYEDPFYDFVILKAEPTDFNPADFEALPLDDSSVEDFLNTHRVPQNQKYWVCSTRSQAQAALDAPIQTADTLYKAGYHNNVWKTNDFIYCREIGMPLRAPFTFQSRSNICFKPSPGSGRCIKGDSGSAILDDFGSVVAVNWGSVVNQGNSVAVPVFWVKQALALVMGHAPNPSAPSAQELCVWRANGDLTWTRLIQVRPATPAEEAETLKFFNAGDLLINLSPSMMQGLTQAMPTFVKTFDPPRASSSYARLVAINGIDLRNLGSVEAALAVIQKVILEAQPEFPAPGETVPLRLELHNGSVLSPGTKSFTYSMPALAPALGDPKKDLICRFSCPDGRPAFQLTPHAGVPAQLPVFVPPPPVAVQLANASRFEPSVRSAGGGGGAAAASPKAKGASEGAFASTVQSPPAQQAQRELQGLRALYSKTTSTPERAKLFTSLGQLSTTQSLLQRAQRELASPSRTPRLSPATKKAIQAQIAALARANPANAAQRVLVRRQIVWLRSVVGGLRQQGTRPLTRK